jgi:hypothetical protein
MTATPPAPRSIAVIDIDGVLADVRHRLVHLDKRPKDWGSFFSAASKDAPLTQGLDAARRLAEVYEVVYLSGRPEHLRRDTEAWFERHDVPPGELHLRPRNDFRPAREFKVSMLQRFTERAPVAVLVDDDADVLEAARQAGFDVLPATWMGTVTGSAQLKELHEAQEHEGRT